MTAENVRQCWALNQNLQRCDMPAGHPGNHAIQYTWEDRDCYDPSNQTPIPVTNPGTVTIPGTPGPLVTEISEPAPTKCVACQHMHKSGQCKCGCHEHIG